MVKTKLGAAGALSVPAASFAMFLSHEQSASRVTEQLKPLLLALTVCLAAILPLAAVVQAQAGSLSNRVANYEIEARLEPEARTVSGTAVLSWRNTGNKPVSSLYFHLYLNAFANNRTSLMTAFPDRVQRWEKRFPGEWGGIDVTGIRVGETDLTQKLEHVPPPDGNPHDRTVARLPLPKRLRPGGVVRVEMQFAARLPRVFLRSGHATPFFFVAQWYPKVGVFENGSWHCRHYHANTEFYADFGTYNVKLTVPRDFVVGHTGVAVAEKENGDGTKTIEVHAEDVHDFAWTADPRFRVINDQVGSVSIRLLIQPAHQRQAERYLQALHTSMVRYEEWFGPYPYPILTVVDPGPGAFAAGGMEYPMLITTGTAWWMPAGVRFPEFVTVHEFGHQYWYGMVANNEFDDAWLDEGINSYVEGLIMDEVYGAGASYLDFLGLRLDATAKNRLAYLAAATWDPVVRPAYAMLDRRSYRSVTYAKTALVLQTLEAIVGKDQLRNALRAHFEAWRFRHPKASDFRAALAANLERDVGWFLDPALETAEVLDYAVTRLRTRKVPPLSGRTVAEAAASSEMRYRTEVVVVRLGQLRMPVDIVVAFEDGSESRETWDGRDRWRRLEVIGTERASYAVVDPDGKLPLEINRINNSKMRSAGTRGVIRLTGRWAFWMQNLLHLLTGF